MPVKIVQIVGEAVNTVIVGLAGFFLAVPTLALVGFGFLAVTG